MWGNRDQRGGIRDQKDGIWDHSPRIRDHKPWDRDQQLFEGSGTIRLYYSCWIRLESKIKNWGCKKG